VRPLVLCYHAVSDRWPHALAVEAGTLERQVRALLRRGFRPVGAAEAVEGRGKLLHVTFDDAYRTAALALPALERLGVPVTVFACSGYAADGRAFDVPELAADAARYPGELLTMPWSELRALAERGIEIGSHTITHPHLSRLSDAEIERELTESRAQFEAELGRLCRFLAYPYGETDGRVVAAAKAAGYEAAWALPGREDRIDRYALPRVGIYRGDGALRLRLKTTAAVRGQAARLRVT